MDCSFSSFEKVHPFEYKTIFNFLPFEVAQSLLLVSLAQKNEKQDKVEPLHNKKRETISLFKGIEKI